MPSMSSMPDREQLQSAMLHASGRGLAPLPHYGGGLWDKIKGFSKEIYNFASPIVQKTAKSFARDVVSGLNRRFQEDEKRIMEI